VKRLIEGEPYNKKIEQLTVRRREDV
jgi:hypothetical protein